MEESVWKKPWDFLFLIWILTSVSDSYATTQWKPNWLPFRNDLQCNDFCQLHKEFIYDKCCICLSQSAWEGTEHNLDFESVTVDGGIIAILPDHYDTAAVYKIEYNHLDMKELPGNICNWNDDPFVCQILQNTSMANLSSLWNSIVFINLSYNRIKSIPDINCLTRLDRLYLDFNEIEHISNTSFANITYLRSVKLNNNRIKTIDPAVVSAPNVNMFLFDMSNNQLETLDVTNMISEKRFCQFNFESNLVSSTTNTFNITLNKNNTYGPGLVSLNDNNFTIFPNLKNLLRLDSLAELGQLLNSSFDLRGQPLNCDCRVQEFVNMTIDILEYMFRDYMNVTCASPEESKGKFVMEVSQDKLICAQVPFCPPSCSCLDKPSEDTVFVNCSNRGLVKMPTYLPNETDSHFLSIDLSQNFIREFSNIQGLHHVRVFNISYNNLNSQAIKEMDVGILLKTSYLDVSNNPELLELPAEIQYRNICNTNLSNLNILCTCDTLWMTAWVNRKCLERQNQTLFTCVLTDGRKLPVEQFTKDILECNGTQKYIITILICLSAFLILLVAVLSCAYLFYYEILILLMKLRSKKTRNVTPQCEYDSFISIDEENDDLRKWVNKTLVPSLENMGYCLFIPCRDILPGDVRDQVVIDKIKQCRSFLLILSESYLAQEDTALIEKEWKYGWLEMQKNRSKRIVIVNFDHVLPSVVKHKQIKAFLRVGSTVDFSNFQRDTIEQISKRIGLPSRLNGLDNENDALIENETQL